MGFRVATSRERLGLLLERAGSWQLDSCIVRKEEGVAYGLATQIGLKRRNDNVTRGVPSTLSKRAAESWTTVHELGVRLS